MSIGASGGSPLTPYPYFPIAVPVAGMAAANENWACCSSKTVRPVAAFGKHRNSAQSSPTPLLRATTSRMANCFLTDGCAILQLPSEKGIGFKLRDAHDGTILHTGYKTVSRRKHIAVIRIIGRGSVNDESGADAHRLGGNSRSDGVSRVRIRISGVRQRDLQKSGGPVVEGYKTIIDRLTYTRHSSLGTFRCWRAA